MATQDRTVVRAKEFRFADTGALERTRTASRGSRPAAPPSSPLRRTPRAASPSSLPRGTVQPLGGLHETTSPNSHAKPPTKGSSSTRTSVGLRETTRVTSRDTARLRRSPPATAPETDAERRRVEDLRAALLGILAAETGLAGAQAHRTSALEAAASALATE